MKKTAVLITIILLIQAGIYSQTMEVGLFGGGSYYLGDINPGMHFQQIKPAVGVIARYNVDTRWSLRLSALTGKLAGYDSISKKYPKRNLKFESPITEIAAVVEFNFFPYVNGSAYNYFTPYIFGGASAFWFNPIANGLRSGLAIPFGLGLKYSMSQDLGLGFEWGMRKTFTDYIDNISLQRNPKTMDWFNFVGISITVEFDIFNKTTCVDFTDGYRK